MTPTEAARTPNLYRATVQEDQFDPDLIAAVRERGETIRTSPRLSGSTIGFWAGIQIDPETRSCQGGKTPFLDGIVVGPSRKH